MKSFGRTSTNPFGYAFFALDGQCHFYASRDESEGIVEGMLSEAESERLAKELHYSQLPGQSGQFGAHSCFDVTGESLYTSSSNLSCGCGCDGAPAFAVEALEHASAWLDELVDKGTTLPGVIRGLAKLQGRVGGPVSPVYDWPLATAVDAIDGLLIDGSEQLSVDSGARFDGADAEALRELRATANAAVKKAESEKRYIDSPLIKGPMDMLQYKLFLQDELPPVAATALKALFDSTPP